LSTMLCRKFSTFCKDSDSWLKASISTPDKVFYVMSICLLRIIVWLNYSMLGFIFLMTVCYEEL
jgi:hypothetical protein